MSDFSGSIPENVMEGEEKERCREWCLHICPKTKGVRNEKIILLIAVSLLCGGPMSAVAAEQAKEAGKLSTFQEKLSYSWAWTLALISRAWVTISPSIS